MAHAISLSDGTLTVDLFDTSAPGAFVTEWDLQSEGDDRESTPTVGDTLVLAIVGTTVAEIQTIVRNIETLLYWSSRRALTGSTDRVFLTVQWDGEASAWRSLVMGGRLEVLGAPATIGQKKVRAELSITRMNWWEGPEVQLTLTNTSASNNTSGLTLYNHHDTGTNHVNYFDVDAAEATGSLPSPVKLELKNTSGGNISPFRLFLSTNGFSSPTTFDAVLEAETDSSGGTPTTQATASNGQTSRVTMTDGGTGALVFTIPAATVAAAAGRRFRVLLVLDYMNTYGILARASIYDSTNTWVLAEGPDVRISRGATSVFTGIIDLGSFALPPVGTGSGWGALALRISFQAPSGQGSTNLDLDFVQITSTDSYRVIEYVGPAVANNTLLVDNGYDNIAYLDVSGVKYPFLNGRGDTLSLMPGKEQRIRVLFDEQMTYTAGRTWAVRAWTRPRRRSI